MTALSSSDRQARRWADCQYLVDELARLTYHASPPDKATVQAAHDKSMVLSCRLMMYLNIMNGAPEPIP